MKTEGNCIICGDNVFYDAQYKKDLDFSSFGGCICLSCRAKGLQFFLMHKKKDFEQEAKEKLRISAREINNRKDKYDGDWWKKDSELYKMLKAILNIEEA